MNELSESDARKIMESNKIERDMLERRSCAQIVDDLGLIATLPLCATDEAFDVSRRIEELIWPDGQHL